MSALILNNFFVHVYGAYARCTADYLLVKMLTTIITGFTGFNYDGGEFALIGRRELIMYKKKSGQYCLITDGYAHSSIQYELHKFDAALDDACLRDKRVLQPILLDFAHYFAPAICATLMYRLGAIVLHLRALGLQDLLPAIVHYYLW